MTCQDHTRSGRTLRLVPSLQPPLGDVGFLALKLGLLLKSIMEFGKCIIGLLVWVISWLPVPLWHTGTMAKDELRVNHPGLGHKWLHTFFSSDFMSPLTDSKFSILSAQLGRITLWSYRCFDKGVLKHSGVAEIFIYSETNLSAAWLQTDKVFLPRNLCDC